jgi:predicted metal-dependent hydrolase
MKYINNPLDTVIEAVEKLYPNINANIQFNPNIKPHKFLWFNWGYCGYTTFPEDNSTPLIDISTNIPFVGMVEVLAHELAHVIVGIKEQHNKNWEEVFDNIQKKYYELMKI